MLRQFWPVWGTVLVLAAAACGSDSSGNQAENTLAQCTDGIDNDNDGLPDCQDPDCQVFVACLDATPQDAKGGSDSTAGDLTGTKDAPRGDQTSGDSPASDSTTPTDDGSPQTDTPSPTGCDPCGYGSIKGRVCAPNDQIFVSGALATVETTNCNGEPIVLTAISKVDGTYLIENVPCGMQTVHVSKGSYDHEYSVPVKSGEVFDVSGADIKMCFGAKVVSIAVLWGQWDAMNDIVDRLGFDYDWYYFKDDLYAENPDWENVEAVKLLLEPTSLAKYNILILNCGSAYLKWVEEFPEIVDNVRDWVLQGGSLYMSDLAWIVGEKAFPDAIDFYGDDDLPDGPMALDGPQQAEGQQTLTATIADAVLAAHVGTETFEVKYGAGPLIVVKYVGEGSQAHVTGTVKIEPDDWLDNTTWKGPLVVSFQPSATSGRVVYTTFHNDEQADTIMLKILYYLVFLL